ncbi:MAG: 50S ribosomal protein L22 [Defluviitaleaceae bacterium]|nr:50S ribosomal protein L22 [Defluviitaleaceae bacterium]
MARGHRSQIKKERNEEKREKRPHAIHKYARISDRKARIVLEQIKGKNVGQALGILKYSPRYGALLIEKVLKSAIANAEHNQDMDVSKLFVEEAIANQGPTFKRMQPRARGMAYRINKKTSHITVILNERKVK